MEPLKPEHANKVTDIKGAPGFQIRRWLSGYCYPENGNTHNPTPRYEWFLLYHGQVIDQGGRRGPLIEAARQRAIELLTGTVRVQLTLAYDVNIAGWAQANDCPATPEDVRYDVQSYWTAKRLIRPGSEGIVRAVEEET